MLEPDAVPPALADHVDAWWDALLHGAPPAADPLAPEPTNEIRRLHAADRTPHADPAFLARLQEELAMTPTAPLAALPLPTRGFAPASNGHASLVPTGPIRAATRPRRRWWGAVERLTAAVLVVGLVGGYLALSAGTPVPGGGAAEDALFLTDSGRQRLYAIDPETLEPVPAATPVAIEPVGDPFRPPSQDWKLSSDGSTVVSFHAPDRLSGSTAEQITIVVRDGLAGPERARFHPPVPIWNNFDLDADGGKLLGQRGQVLYRDGLPDIANPQEWYVFDTTSGRVLSTISTGELWSASGSQARARLSPDGQRVFVFGETAAANPPGPGSLHLFVYDAQGGFEIGRLDLPDVLSGRWVTARSVDGLPVAEYLSVGIAFSPDGRRLALMHDGGASLTVVDTDRLAVERRVAVNGGTDPMDVASPVPATPEVLDERDDLPYEEGRGLWVAFAADGRALYVAGWDRRVDGSGRETCRDLPLRRMDANTGTVLAVATPRMTFGELAVGTDGESLFAVGPLSANACFVSDQGGSLLVRLDAETLVVGAERKVPGYPTLELIPRVAGGWWW